MLETIFQTALITLVVCVTVFLFSLVTMKYWWWCLKIDVFLFWLRSIATKLERQMPIEKNGGKKMWKQIYEYLDFNNRKN